MLDLKIIALHHTEVAIVNYAVGKHEVDGDDGSQNIDLADEDEGHGDQAGQTDGSHRGLIGPLLLNKKKMDGMMRTMALSVAFLSTA